MPVPVVPDFALGDIIARNEAQLVSDYVAAQQKTRAIQLMKEDELRRQCATILSELGRGDSYDAASPRYATLRQLLGDMSRTRALQGFSPAETAMFVFSLKNLLLPYIQKADVGQPEEVTRQVVATNQLLDAFGMLTFETYAQGRESLIREQSRAIRELSTPVVQLWNDILALPIVGSIDTARSQQVMESLLTRIVETGSTVVIIDITGVPIVDTAVAKHLLQTVSAARLLGAESVIVGISSRIAQTLVHLGVDLSTVVTRISMAKGLEYALARTGQRVIRTDTSRSPVVQAANDGWEV